MVLFGYLGAQEGLTPFRCVTYITHWHHSHSCSPGASLFFWCQGITITSGRVFQLSGLTFHFPKWVLLLFCPTPSSNPLKLFGICYSKFWKNRFLQDLPWLRCAATHPKAPTAQFGVIFQMHTNTDHFLNKMCNWASILQHSL